MKKNSNLRLLLMPLLLASFLLTGCGAGSDSEEVTGQFGGPTLSTVRRGAAPLVAFDVPQQANPAVGVYKYAVSDAQEVVGTLVVPDDADYDLYFYDANGDRVAKVETSGNGIDESLEYTIAGFSTLYVVIYDGIGGIHDNEGGSYNFTLSLKADPQVVEMTEVDETVESNDIAENAQEITNHTIVSGNLNRPSLANCASVDCDDFYVLDITEGDTLNISLTGDSGTNFNLNLFQADGTYIVHSENPDSNEELEYIVPNGMSQLVVHVLAYNGTGTYTLTITSSAE